MEPLPGGSAASWPAAHPLVTEYQVELASAHGNLGRLYAETPPRRGRALSHRPGELRGAAAGERGFPSTAATTARVAVNLGELLGALASPTRLPVTRGRSPFWSRSARIWAAGRRRCCWRRRVVGRAEAAPPAWPRHREAAEAWEQAESDVPVSNRPLVRPAPGRPSWPAPGDHAPAARLVRATMEKDAGTDGSVAYQAAMALTCAAGAAGGRHVERARPDGARRSISTEAFRLLAQPVARRSCSSPAGCADGTLADWGPLRALPGYPAFVTAVNGSPAGR
ncbi:MAG: hypothetical protein U0736_09050 [Gemmataceae bacterium]